MKYAFVLLLVLVACRAPERAHWYRHYRVEVTCGNMTQVLYELAPYDDTIGYIIRYEDGAGKPVAIYGECAIKRTDKYSAPHMGLIK